MSVSASVGSRRRAGFLTRCPPPSAGGRTARRRPMGNSHDTLHEPNEPTDRLRCRRRRAPWRLRDRPRLQAPFGGPAADVPGPGDRSEEHTSELQSQSNLVCRLLLEKKKKKKPKLHTP